MPDWVGSRWSPDIFPGAPASAAGIDREQVAAALPGYDLGRELGAGGFGQVFEGWHRGLQRHVAVKVLYTRGHGAQIDDLVREARLLARLDHPHIIRVYDYVHAQAGDLHLIVMELMASGPLSRRQQTMTQQAACAVGLAVAGALAYAHSQGVLHRDIKPDNMLFDAVGLLKVADFGIAKLLSGVSGGRNTVIGTPLFMPPEQLVGGSLSPATDLYALGVVLQLLLTGGSTVEATLSPSPGPRPDSDHTGSLPRALADPLRDVIQHALEADPAARPPTAHAFGLALATAAASAFGPGWLTRSAVPVRLEDDIRAVAEPHAGSAAPVPPASVPSPHKDTPVAARRGDALGVGRHARPRARLALPRRRILAAGLFAVAGAVPAGYLLAAALTKDPGGGVADPLGALPQQHTDWILSLRFSPDGTMLASGSKDGTVRLWDMTDPAAPRSIGGPLPGRSPGVTSVAFSPDGNTLASANWDGTLQLWDITERASPQSLGAPLPAHAILANSVVFLDRGQTLASAGRQETRLWNITDGAAPEPIGSPILGDTDWPRLEVVDRPRMLLARVGENRTIRIWDVSNAASPHQRTRLVSSHAGAVHCVAFSQDLRLMATGGKDATLRLWNTVDLANPQMIGKPVTGHHNTIWSVLFSPDDRIVATASYDGTMGIWNVEDPEHPRLEGLVPSGQEGWLMSLACSLDRAAPVLASGSQDGTIRLWRLTGTGSDQRS
ncbi:serine/threonine-protein kinase [Frankia sp. CcI49]|uniref:WD40 repeat domain-containing serine/threonine protein kinase n=1 Tax=Frankia sp. CcI49 TaxID=1745382 RepID=UPI001F52AB02|nr:serine/threonine-protein kinase [Frankia sp. CcI49]